MKLYKPEQSPTIMRVNIKKQGCQAEHIAIAEATQDEVLDWLKALIRNQNLDILASGRITTVEVRESVAGKNGKVVSFAFKGLDPLEIKNLILKHI